MADLETRITAIEEWIEAFEASCKEAEAELQSMLDNDVTIESVPSDRITVHLLRDKSRDN